MATDEHTTKVAQRVLKRLINYVIDHLDEEQAPPSLQSLNNNTFARGFEAGYREAYRQWGVEIEDRITEAFEEGRAHGHREEKEGWVSNHGEGLCTSLDVSTPRIRTVTDAATQATPATAQTASQMASTTTVNAVMQTASDDEPPRPLRDAGTSTELLSPPTTTPTVDASTQTASNVPPRLLNDAGTSTEPPSTCNMGSQACGEPPAPPAPATSSPIPVNAATSPLTTPTQPPSTLSTTATTATTSLLPPSKQRAKDQKRRHTLPGRPATPQMSPQAPEPLLSHPAVATSRPPTPTPPTATAPKTASRAASSAQTATATLETATHVPGSPQRRRTTKETPSREAVRTRSSERVVHSTERVCQPHSPQRRSRRRPTPPWHPQPAPLAPVLPLSPTTTPHASTRAATSSTRASTTTAFSPARPHSGPRAAAPGPPERSQVQPHPPSSPQIPRKRAVSASSGRYTPPASPTTPSAPSNARCPPPASCSPPICPSSPQFGPKQAVPSPPASYKPAMSPTMPSRPVKAPRPLSTPSSPPTHPSLTLLDRKRAVSPSSPRFDWADDAASLPTGPTPHFRDLSCLKTDCPRPFGNLRRRTRRRRAPPRIFSSQKIFHSVIPSLVSSQSFISRRHPSGIGPGKPIITVPFGTAPAPAPAPVPKLDWDGDPRLVDLSCALRALGWTPPC